MSVSHLLFRITNIMLLRIFFFSAFTCTIAAINSAIVKLATVTPLPPGHLLYRGLNCISFPPELLDIRGRSSVALREDTDGSIQCEDVCVSQTCDFKDTCRGFVEFAFSSASTEKAVALDYSGYSACRRQECQSWNEEEGFCEAHRPTLLEIETGQIDR